MMTVEATECTPKEEAIVIPEGILKKMEAIAIGEGSPTKEAIVVSEGSPKKAETIVLPGGALKKEEAIVIPEGILKKMEAIAIGEGSPTKEAIVVSEGSPKKAEAIVLPGGALKKEVVAAGKTDETQKMRRIQVSNTKKPLFFYINLAKRYIKQSNHVELSALGTAIPTAVIIAEILKGNGLATQKDISISTVGTMDEIKGRLILKAKIEIMLGKTEDFNNLTRNASKPSKKAANKK